MARWPFKNLLHYLKRVSQNFEAGLGLIEAGLKAGLGILEADGCNLEAGCHFTKKSWSATKLARAFKRLIGAQKSWPNSSG